MGVRRRRGRRKLGIPAPGEVGKWAPNVAAAITFVGMLIIAIPGKKPEMRLRRRNRAYRAQKELASTSRETRPSNSVISLKKSGFPFFLIQISAQLSNASSADLERATEAETPRRSQAGVRREDTFEL